MTWEKIYVSAFCNFKTTFSFFENNLNGQSYPAMGLFWPRMENAFNAIFKHLWGNFCHHKLFERCFIEN